MRPSLIVAALLTLSLAAAGSLAAQSPVTSAPQDGPFGFMMGMSRDSLTRTLTPASTGATVPAHVVMVTSAPQPYAKAEWYALTFGSTGLCKVLMVTVSQERDAYGDKLRSQFTAIHDAITARYGRSKQFDFLRAGSIWRESREWMMALRQEERHLASFWDRDEGSTLPAWLKSVSLTAVGQSNSDGYLRVAYDFANVEQCMGEAQRAQDSVF